MANVQPIPDGEPVPTPYLCVDGAGAIPGAAATRPFGNRPDERCYVPACFTSRVRYRKLVVRSRICERCCA